MIAVWMSMLLLFGGISTALIHQFVNHKDGVDPERKGLVFEKRHHHCSFLGFSLSPFTNNSDIPILRFIRIVFSVSTFAISDNYVPHYHFHALLRGPPSHLI